MFTRGYAISEVQNFHDHFSKTDQSEKILCTVSRVGSYSATQVVHQTWRAGKSLITSMLFPAKTLRWHGFFFGGVEDEPEAEAGAEASNSQFLVAESHFLPLENPENPWIFRRFLFGALRKREV